MQLLARFASVRGAEDLVQEALARTLRQRHACSSEGCPTALPTIRRREDWHQLPRPTSTPGLHRAEIVLQAAELPGP
jgi:hypothetical protein